MAWGKGRNMGNEKNEELRNEEDDVDQKSGNRSQNEDGQWFECIVEQV
jgi:hypothetical protein